MQQLAPSLRIAAEWAIPRQRHMRGALTINRTWVVGHIIEDGHEQLRVGRAGNAKHYSGRLEASLS